MFTKHVVYTSINVKVAVMVDDGCDRFIGLELKYKSLDTCPQRENSTKYNKVTSML